VGALESFRIPHSCQEVNLKPQASKSKRITDPNNHNSLDRAFQSAGRTYGMDAFESTEFDETELCETSRPIFVDHRTHVTSGHAEGT